MTTVDSETTVSRGGTEVLNEVRSLISDLEVWTKLANELGVLTERIKEKASKNKAMKYILEDFVKATDLPYARHLEVIEAASDFEEEPSTTALSNSEGGERIQGRRSRKTRRKRLNRPGRQKKPVRQKRPKMTGSTLRFH